MTIVNEMINKKWNAQAYSENSQLQYQASKLFFDELSLKGNEIILDIGCGTGLLASEIAKIAPQIRIIGIDSSDSMIEFANENFAQSNLEFILMRAEELNFPFTFDVIISSFCIQWIKDKQALFNKIAAHLKKEGLIRFIMPFRHEELALIRSRLMANLKWSQYFDVSEAQEILVFDNQYDHYAKNAGLDNVDFQTEKVTTKFANSTKLITFLENITSYLERLPTKYLRDEFMQELVDLYLKDNHILADGSCSVTYTYGKLIAIGKK